MNNKIIPISVFLVFLFSAILSGQYSFQQARYTITADLNQALCQIVQEKRGTLICQDTIRAYKLLQTSSEAPVSLAIADDRFRDCLKHEQLKDGAFISLDIADDAQRIYAFNEKALQSDTLVIKDEQLGETFVLKGYSEPSFATIFSVSDQRWSFTFASFALLWALLSWFVFYRKQEEVEVNPALGGIRYSAVEDVFYGSNGQPIHFTPMQQQLMLLFWNHPAHSVAKEEICAELWPKKTDANDTLYTLVRRIKPILEEHTKLKLTADRGKCYSLEINELDG